MKLFFLFVIIVSVAAAGAETGSEVKISELHDEIVLEGDSPVAPTTKSLKAAEEAKDKDLKDTENGSELVHPAGEAGKEPVSPTGDTNGPDSTTTSASGLMFAVPVMVAIMVKYM